MLRVRPYVPDDRTFILSLAPRLAIGRQPWRDLALATVSHSIHFTGQRQAYIGELATRDKVEGRGVGSALVAACEQWAREQGYTMITLTTGAGNTRALGFYNHLGFQKEDVTLTKLL
jgi:GNAT superfamily N-acetyltransferase